MARIHTMYLGFRGCLAMFQPSTSQKSVLPFLISVPAAQEIGTRQIAHAAFATLDCLPTGVLLLDDFGNIEFANLTIASLLQTAQSDLQGRALNTTIFDFRNNNDDVEVVAKFATARKRDGSSFTVEVTEGVLELDGRCKKLLSVRKVSAQEEFSRKHRDFIAQLVHELKTPLASLTGVMSMLEEGILGQLNLQGSKTTARIKQTCKRMAKLLDEMLDLERLQAGKFTLECKSVSLHSVLKSVVESARPLAENRRITFAVPRGLSCIADEDRLIQVALNLLSNAIKNSPDCSSITVRAEQLGSGVRISVEDQGRGIPEAKISRIFEVFEQVDIRDSKNGGTGLGLAICKAIVQEHGGQIGVCSQLGKGCRFWFTLPGV